MSAQYILVVGDSSPERAVLVDQLSSRTGLTPVFSTQQIAALVQPACGWVAVGTSGCIIGSLFPRDGQPHQITSFRETQAKSIVRSNGDALLTEFWGGYVAAISGPEAVRILRDPSGDFPCYHTSFAGFAIFAADAELLVNGAVASVSIDFDAIGRQLYRAFVPSPKTALRGIHELLAGFALCVAGAVREEPCWSPWDHVQVHTDMTGEAAERLSQTIQRSVMAWASTQDRILLSVSGGLDSSIVAACLAKSGMDTVCLTMFSDDASGDERPFARTLCNRLGLPLIERPYRLEDISLTEPMAPNVPNPWDRAHSMAYKLGLLSVATQVGASALMAGAGGDNVLGYSQTAAPVADRYLTEGLGRNTLVTLLDVCRQTGCSAADALFHAVRLVSRAPAYHVRPNHLFLHPDFIAGCGKADLWHSWLSAPKRALPGKAAHIATILRAQATLDPGSMRFPVINPLMSQPVIEACLGIPSWEWREGGRDRALARRAFMNDLPALVLDRRVKGSPSHFASRVLAHFLGPIRDCLLSGRLALHGIIDSSALERVLASEDRVSGLERVRILDLVNIEAWINHWETRTETPKPSETNIKLLAHGRHPV